MLKRVLVSQFPKFRCAATATSTVDHQEVQQFNKFVSEWWDEFGPMKPLHSMNKLRIPFIRDGLVNAGTIGIENVGNPLILKNISLLDVGCGGGILLEPLAKLGANVTGIDASANVIELAKAHAKLNCLDINYTVSSIEDHALNNAEKYDAVIASEVVEHVTKKEEFLEACIKCLKPTGSIFITTVNQTFLANLAVVLLGENVFRLLPKGTHQYEKFISPVKLQRMLEDCNCRTELLHGVAYNIFTNSWHWCTDTSINYGIQAVKLSSCD